MPILHGISLLAGLNTWRELCIIIYFSLCQQFSNSTSHMSSFSFFFFPINRILSVFLSHFSMAIASNDDKHFRIYEAYFDTYSRTSRQKSNQIYLSCSMFYLLEGFSKESYRRGHLSVGWSLHNNTSLFERPLVGNRTTWILPGCLKFPLIKT